MYVHFLMWEEHERQRGGRVEQKLTGGEGGGGDGGEAAGGNTYVKTASMEVDGEEIELRR